MRFVLPWRRERALNLPETWQAIVNSGQQIAPAKVGPVKPLTAKKEHEFMKLLKRQA